MRTATIQFVAGVGLELRTPYDADFVTRLKSTVPHYARTWQADRKIWIVSEEWRVPVVDLLKQFFSVVDIEAEAQERKRREEEAAREREQARQQREQAQEEEREEARQWGREWEQQQRQQRQENAAGPHATLHLLRTAPPELVKAAFHCLAKLYHPDRGGDLAKMQALNSAYEKLQR